MLLFAKYTRHGNKTIKACLPRYFLTANFLQDSPYGKSKIVR